MSKQPEKIEFPPEIPLPLHKIIPRSCYADRSERYQSVNEFHPVIQTYTDLRGLYVLDRGRQHQNAFQESSNLRASEEIHMQVYSDSHQARFTFE